MKLGAHIACAVVGLTLVACGPVPVLQAERNCLSNARAATAPRSEVAVGVVSDGHRVRPAASLELNISSDYMMGKDPSEVFNNCVLRQSGELPTRPLYDQPGWGAR